MTEGVSHSLKHESNQPYLRQDSLTKLRVICTTTEGSKADLLSMWSLPDLFEPVMTA